jgi:hypothetical protein
LQKCGKEGRIHKICKGEEFFMRNAENISSDRRKSLEKWIGRVSASHTFAVKAEFFRDENPLGFRGTVELPERWELPDTFHTLHQRAARLSGEAQESDTPWLLYEQAARFEELALNLVSDSDDANIRKIGIHAVRFAERAGNDSMIVRLGRVVLSKLGEETADSSTYRRIERMMGQASLRLSVDASLSARSASR